MNIALYDADNTNFHNLALMKISAHHKKKGDNIQQYIPLLAHTYDKVYASKVFTFNDNTTYTPKNTILGGTGYGLYQNLPDEIEHTCPDYEIYHSNTSLGFLTRGCIRACPWCIVPKKEGKIHPHADITEFLRHKQVVIMDNNVLAHDHGIQQIEKIAKLGVKVDFNQGLDARLIDKSTAQRLAKLKWLSPVRLACDTKEQMPTIEKAVKLLRKAGVKPKEYFCYVLVKNIDDALERCLFLDSLGVRPFAQPYRDFSTNKEPEKILKAFSRWVNMRATFKTCKWEDYKYNKQYPPEHSSVTQKL